VDQIIDGIAVDGGYSDSSPTRGAGTTLQYSTEIVVPHFENLSDNDSAKPSSSVRLSRLELLSMSRIAPSCWRQYRQRVFHGKSAKSRSLEHPPFRPVMVLLKFCVLTVGCNTAP
jgi:hypothetical protein